MNIVVTGANGQLGSEIRELSKKHTHHHFFFTDINELNICDPDAVHHFIQLNHIHLIINCAAYTAVDAAEDNRELCDDLNHKAPGILASVAATHQIGLLHISTDYVFDGKTYRPYTEDDATSPQSVYGITKRKGEELIMRCLPTAMIIRTSWLYSSYGNNFVKTMLRLGRERSELGVVFDQVGTPTYAADLADSILSIIDKGLIGGIYHYSNEGICSWYDFTKAIHRMAGITTCSVKPIHTVDYPTKAPRPYYSVLDKTKIKQCYSLSIPQWEESLAKCIAILNK